MPPVKKDGKNEGEIRVTLVRFDEPSINGVTFAYAQLQKAIDGPFMKRVSDKSMFGEARPPNPDLGPVRFTEIAEEEVALRLTSFNLHRHAMFGRVVPAGPKKDEFINLISQYREPIPLAMRAFRNENGELTIVSFDLCASLLQNHPKKDDAFAAPGEVSDGRGPTVGPAMTLGAQPADPATVDAALAMVDNALGGTMEQNSQLNQQTIAAANAEGLAAAGKVAAVKNAALKKPYVKPSVETVSEEEYDQAVNPKRKKAAKKTARGVYETHVIANEFGRTPTDELNAQNIADFDVYFNALKNDDEVRLVVGDRVKINTHVTQGEYISFFHPDYTMHSLARWTDSNDRVTYVVSPIPVTGGSITYTTPEEVRKGLDLLQSIFEQAANEFINRNKESAPVTTPIPTVAPEKKLSAKAVFKTIEPIVSKNVEAHYDQVFRVNPKGKLDGTFKKLGDKKGAFVRLAGSPDVYMLPYTVKSEKASAGERSLNSALATRNIEVLSVDDLNPAPAETVQFKFVEKKVAK